MNWQTFRTRALTAIIFAVVMLAGLLINHWSFFLLFSVIHFGCWIEYFRLLESIHGVSFHRYVQLGFVVSGFALVLFATSGVYHINDYTLRGNAALPCSIAGFILLIMGLFLSRRVQLKAFAAAMAGWVYISLAFAALMYLKDEALFASTAAWVIPASILLPLVVIGCMWVNDTMAYIVGSLIGRTPLSPISPKKTWEGTIGGIIAASLLMGWLAWLMDRDLTRHSMIWWIGLCVVATVAGTFGDLLESKLKRMAGVKDSGTLMPGHGGFLDRFDSLLLAIPFVTVYILFG